MAAGHCGLGALERRRPSGCSTSWQGPRPMPATSSVPTMTDVGAVQDPVLDAEANWVAGLGHRAVLPGVAVDLPHRRADPAVQRRRPAPAPADPCPPRGARRAVLLPHGEMPHGPARRAAARPPDQRDEHRRHLERLGHVRRVAHPTDRRTTLARITPRGAARSRPRTPGWRRRFGVAALTESQAKAVFKILTKVRLAS